MNEKNTIAKLLNLGFNQWDPQLTCSDVFKLDMVSASSFLKFPHNLRGRERTSCFFFRIKNQAEDKPFCENVNNYLVLSGDELDKDITIHNLFLNKMVINFNVFGSYIEDRIGSQARSSTLLHHSMGARRRLICNFLKSMYNKKRSAVVCAIAWYLASLLD